MSPDLPDGIDPVGVPAADTGRNTFVLTAAVLVAVLGLVFTLGWIVFHQLTGDAGDVPAPPEESGLVSPTVTTPT